MKLSIPFGIALLAALSTTAETTNQTTTVEKTREQIIVSATLIDTPIEQIGSSVSVISAQEIKLMNAKTAQQALRQVPGIQATQNGGPGTASSIFIRGANSNHTLILVNGIRVNSNTTGGFNLSTIPTDSIAQIEVLRGPQSALYGGDAIGGVINIVTKKGQKGFGGTVLTEIGTKGYANGMISLYGGGEIIDFTASLSYKQLKEYDIAKEYGGTEDDPFESLSLFTDLGFNFAGDGRADWVIIYDRNKNALDQNAPWSLGSDNYWQVDDLNRETTRDFFMTSLDISKPITDFYEQSIKAGISHNKIEGEDDGLTEYEYINNNLDLNAQGDFFLRKTDTLSFGYDFRRSEAENKGKIPLTHRTQNSVYANNQFTPDENLYIDMGIRYDDYSDFDGRGTWQAKISRNIWEPSRLHASIGTGYKVPTFNDMYWPLSGNQNLDPEKSRSFDIGWEQSMANRAWVADLTYFESEIEDMIAWAPIGGGSWLWQPSNVNNAIIKGVETSLSFQPISTLNGKIYYTYTDAKDADTGKWLARRARNNAGFFISWDYLKNANINLDLTYTGKRYDNASNTRELDPYELVHIGTSYNITESTQITANINNLFDKYYETAAGYGTIGRVFSVGANYTF